jgi:diacylglycerol kinase family enzyme
MKKLIFAIIAVALMAVSAVSAGTVYISPSSPTTDQNLTCGVSGTNAYYNFYWYKNGSLVKKENGASSTLSKSYTTAGQTWLCKAFRPSTVYTPEILEGQYSVLIKSGDVFPMNQAPVLDPIGNKSVWEGNKLQFTISATDPDGDNLTYSATNLPDGATFSGRTFTWNTDYTDAGVYPNVVFFVSDNKEGWDNESITISVYENDPQPVNHAPVLNAIGDKTEWEGNTLQFTVSATDSDGDNLTYSAVNLPDDATFVGQTFTWNTDYTDAGVYKNVLFRVTDGEKWDWEYIDITIYDKNRKPVLNPIGDKTVKEGDTLQFTVSATDADGDSLTYTAANLPDDSTFTGQTFTWNTDYTDAGVYKNVLFKVTDSKGGWDYEYIDITVTDGNRKPEFNPIGNKTVKEGDKLTFTVSATDPDNDSLTYSATNLPDDSTFVGQTFTWQTDHTDADVYENIEFKVTDGKGGWDTEAITITVTDDNRAPVLNPIGDKTVKEGTKIEFTVSATDADNDSLTYSATNLPDDATFTGQTFTWQTGSKDAGVYEGIKFTVSDGKGGSDSEIIKITVIDVPEELNKAKLEVVDMQIMNINDVKDKLVVQVILKNNGSLAARNLELRLRLTDTNTFALTNVAKLGEGKTYSTVMNLKLPTNMKAGKHTLALTVEGNKVDITEHKQFTLNKVEEKQKVEMVMLETPEPEEEDKGFFAKTWEWIKSIIL